jgi:hypothetical protein
VCPNHGVGDRTSLPVDNVATTVTCESRESRFVTGILTIAARQIMQWCGAKQADPLSLSSGEGSIGLLTPGAGARAAAASALEIKHCCLHHMIPDKFPSVATMGVFLV